MVNQNLSKFLKPGNHTCLLKYILTSAIGFGIGCTVWGFRLFELIPDMGHYVVPFSYLTGGIIVGAIGGAFLALPSRDILKILLSSLSGMIGLFIGFLVGVALSYPLFFFGHYFILFLIPTRNPDQWEFLFSLHPSLGIGVFVFVFAVVGAIGGFFYSIALKKRIGPLILAGMLGFAIGSLIGPLVGNLTEMIFESLLMAYITTFLTIGLFAGTSFGIGMYFAEKSSISK